MHTAAHAAIPPPPPIPTANGLPPALPTPVQPVPVVPTSAHTTTLPMTGGRKFPVKAIVGGALGAGLGFLMLGPLGAIGGALLGAFLGSRM